MARVIISAKLTPEIWPAWQIIFDNANVTREELGWLESPSTAISYTLLGAEEVYKTVVINVDARTGDILLKSALELAITEERAIDIAAGALPAEVVRRANMRVKLVPNAWPHGAWQITFDDAYVTREELGWQEGPNTLLADYAVCKTVLINVDAKTGDILLKMATSAPSSGGPAPSRPVAPSATPTSTP